MQNWIIYAVLIVVVGLAVWGTVKRIRHGSSCCGEHEAGPAKIKVKDKNKKNYPFVYELRVDGMYCSNCARRVENGFNKSEGMWATADVGQKSVRLRSKRQVDKYECRKIVSDAGYTLLSIKEINT